MISYVILVVVVFAYSGRVASEASGASGLRNIGHSFLITTLADCPLKPVTLKLLI